MNHVIFKYLSALVTYLFIIRATISPFSHTRERIRNGSEGLLEMIQKYVTGIGTFIRWIQKQLKRYTTLHPLALARTRGHRGVGLRVVVRVVVTVRVRVSG